MFNAVSAAAVPVSAPMLSALSVTCASPATAPTLMTFAVFVPAVAFPIVGVMFSPWLTFVPVVSTGVVKVRDATF